MPDAVLIDSIMERIRRIPVFETLGIEILSFGEGSCKARIPHDKNFDGIYESFHGGMLMTAADTIACFAMMTQTGPEGGFATTDMNIRFLAPCLTDVIVEARVIKLGRTLVPVHVDLYDLNGRHVAVAQVSYIRLSDSPKRG